MTKKSQEPEDVFGVIRLFRQMEKNGWSDRAYANWKRKPLTLENIRWLRIAKLESARKRKISEYGIEKKSAPSFYCKFVSVTKWPINEPDKKLRARILVDYKRI